MKKLILFVFGTIVNLSLMAQAPSIEWQKSLGGTADDMAWAVNKTADGGYILGGFSSSFDGDVTGNHGNYDFWIVKLTSTGNLQWQKSLGGSLNDFCYAIEQTSDGGYIAAGCTASNNGDVTGNHGSNDFWVVKLDSLGALQWQKTIGGAGSDIARQIHQTTDGGYIVGGWSVSNDGNVTGHHGSGATWDYWIVKLNSTGAIEWQKSLGGTNDDYLYDIIQTSDGGFFAVGSSMSLDGDVSGNHGVDDYWVVKLSTLGVIQWQKSLGGSSNDAPNAAIQTLDGGYVVTGLTASTDGDVTGIHGGQDAWVVKLSSVGSMQWQKTYGGTSTDRGFSVQQLADSDLILGMYTWSTDGDVSGNHGGGDGWLVRTNATGTITWQKAIGGSDMDQVVLAIGTNDGGFVMAGNSNSNDGDISGNHGGFDYSIVKLEGTTEVAEVRHHPAIQLYPNPTTGQVTVNGADVAAVKVFNLTGSLVCQSIQSHDISLSGLPAGMYFVQLFSAQGDMLHVEKIVKE